jgi:hypothetical protein
MRRGKTRTLGRMAIRLSISALVLAIGVHLMGLWPLPSEVAKQRFAFWTNMKSEANAIDPSKSDRPHFDVQIRERMLGDINAVLSNPDQLLAQARFEWALYLVAAAFTAVAAFTVMRRWRYWPWTSVGSAIVFFWLYHPFAPFRLFYAEGRFDLASGIAQLKLISEHPTVFWTMLFVTVVAVLLILVVLYAVIRAYRQSSIKGAANAT